MGDGVLQIEFHSKMNAIGGDIMQMLHAGVKEASQNFAALVVGNDAPNFSAGANLMLLLLEAQEGNWDEVDLMVRAFQGATMALKHADVPVVVAPAGLALGGGCEIALHGARVQAAAETYIGLVEVGVGLIPAGGGTKEMLARAMEALPAGADPLPHVQRVFETIGFAKVSTSGPEARRLGYLRDGDEITMNRDRLLADAKAHALQLASGLHAGAAAIRDSCRRRGHLRHAQARRPPRLARRPHQRSRRRDRPEAGLDSRRRQPPARRHGDGTAVAGPRTRGVPEPVRRAEDARAHRAYVEDGEAAEELTLQVRRGSSGTADCRDRPAVCRDAVTVDAAAFLEALARAVPRGSRYTLAGASAPIAASYRTASGVR